LNEFCFRRKRIEKRRFDYARNSYRDEFIDFLPCSYPRALPRTSSHALNNFSQGPNHCHMVLVPKRTTFRLDTLVMAHVLIMVIVFHIGMVFLQEDLTLVLSRDTWMVHVFHVVVLVPLIQTVMCKRLWRLPQVAWLSARFLRFISLTPALSHQPFLILCR
jgi:hypothetical protein